MHRQEKTMRWRMRATNQLVRVIWRCRGRQWWAKRRRETGVWHVSGEGKPRRANLSWKIQNLDSKFDEEAAIEGGCETSRCQFIGEKNLKTNIKKHIHNWGRILASRSSEVMNKVLQWAKSSKENRSFSL